MGGLRIALIASHTPQLQLVGADGRVVVITANVLLFYIKHNVIRRLTMSAPKHERGLRVASLVINLPEQSIKSFIICRQYFLSMASRYKNHHTSITITVSSLYSSFYRVPNSWSWLAVGVSNLSPIVLYWTLINYFLTEANHEWQWLIESKTEKALREIGGRMPLDLETKVKKYRTMHLVVVFSAFRPQTGQLNFRC